MNHKSKKEKSISETLAEKQQYYAKLFSKMTMQEVSEYVQARFTRMINFLDAEKKRSEEELLAIRVRAFKENLRRSVEVMFPKEDPDEFYEKVDISDATFQNVKLELQSTALTNIN